MRVYNFDGVDYPSVTTILGILDKPALVSWSARMAANYVRENYHYNCDIDKLCNEAAVNFRKASKDACDIGTEVHDAIENHIKGKEFLFSVRPEVETAVKAYIEWEKDNILEYIEVELPVFCKDIPFAGRFDMIAKMKDGRILLLDLKTSKAIYDEYITQLSAYKIARESMSGSYDFIGEIVEYNPIKIDGIGIIRVDKESGLSEFKDCTNKFNQKANAFEFLVHFYYADKKRRLNNNPWVK